MGQHPVMNLYGVKSYYTKMLPMQGFCGASKKFCDTQHGGVAYQSIDLVQQMIESFCIGLAPTSKLLELSFHFSFALFSTGGGGDSFLCSDQFTTN